MAFFRFSVSLKQKMGARELHRLVCDVRRRVEHEITFEGRERKIKYVCSEVIRSRANLGVSFMSTLLPPTPDSMQHVLMQGGISQSLAMRSSPVFDSLLKETRSLLLSPDFSVVLEVCLDRATEILFNGLQKNVFMEGRSITSEGESGEETKLRLAGLLPGMARWSHLALHGLPNELVDVRIRISFISIFPFEIF
jgi:peroxin-3